jgi:hypothetical protein
MIGKRITHKEYGNGTIIPDVECLCNNTEFLVSFDSGFYRGRISNEKYARLHKTYVEIVNKEDIQFKG